MENLIEIILKIVGFIVLESLPEQVSETLKLIGGVLLILIAIVVLGQPAFQMLAIAGAIGGVLYLFYKVLNLNT